MVSKLIYQIKRIAAFITSNEDHETSLRNEIEKYNLSFTQDSSLRNGQPFLLAFSMKGAELNSAKRTVLLGCELRCSTDIAPNL
jgi:hypothetical protein